MSSRHNDPGNPNLPMARPTGSKRSSDVHTQNVAGAATTSTLEGFAGNGDGTYDGRKVARWLFEAVTGKPMSEVEGQALVDEAMRRRACRK